MKYFIIFGFILLIGFNSGFARAQEALNEVDMRKILNQACNDANEFYRSEKFPILAPKPDGCIFSLKTDDDYKESTALFDLTHQDLVGGEILQASGRIIKFNNYAISHVFGSELLKKGEFPSRWTSAHAIEIATKFAGIFLKQWQGYYFSEPVAKATWPKATNDPQPVLWRVVWYRVSPSGVRLFGDAVVVDISEKYGPMAIDIFLALHDSGEKITPIPQDKALVEARKGLDTILAWDSAKKWLPNSQITAGPDTPWLMMIRPNRDLKGDFDKAPSSSLDTRPAWVVHYAVQSKSDPNAHGTVTIYIDAKDGSFLGGTF